MIDKLDLITRFVKPEIAHLAQSEGTRDGYRHYIDLRKTHLKLPVKLFHLGYRRGSSVSKLVFVQVSKLSVRRVRAIVRQICGYAPLRIFRIDFAFDLVGVTAIELNQHCWVRRVQKSATFNSAKGFSGYPRFSRTHKVLIYDKLLLRDGIKRKGVRVEVQFYGQSVPLKNFSDLEQYGRLNVLRGIKFQRFRAMKPGLTPLQKLAGWGMQSAARELGLQVARKLVPASSWTMLRRKFFRVHRRFQKIPSRMRRENREWLREIARSSRTVNGL